MSVGDAVIDPAGARLCVVGFHRIVRNDFDGVLLVPSAPSNRVCAVIETAAMPDPFGPEPGKGLGWYWPWEIVPDGCFDPGMTTALVRTWKRHVEFPDPRLVSARETQDVGRFAAGPTAEDQLRMRAWRTAMQHMHCRPADVADTSDGQRVARAEDTGAAAPASAVLSLDNVVAFCPRKPA